MKPRLLSLMLVLMLIPFAVQATPILQVDDAGRLTGAFNVEIAGALYDVSFVDGTCVELFGGCDDLSDFMFPSPAEAISASLALFDQVLLDGPAGQFDSIPSLVSGCGFGMSVCYPTTPFGLAQDRVVTVLAANYEFQVAPDATDLTNWSIHYDMAENFRGTWAVWSRAIATPEPGSLLLMSIGLLGLRSGRRQPRR